MPWTQDGKKLWNYINGLGVSVKILSAPLTEEIDISSHGKIIWCKENLGKNVKLILDDYKYKYATDKSILIDDLEKFLGPWENNGGIGIQYKSYEQTVRDLNEIFNKEA